MSVKRNENDSVTISGFIPPCGIYCGRCPNFLRLNSACEGAEKHCTDRKCKGIFVCCKEKKGFDFCFECGTFPCSRFKKFAEGWIKYGQDLILNQQKLKELGAKEWLKRWEQESRQED